MQMAETQALEEETGETFDILRFLQTAADYHLVLVDRSEWDVWVNCRQGHER